MEKCHHKKGFFVWFGTTQYFYGKNTSVCYWCVAVLNWRAKCHQRESKKRWRLTQLHKCSIFSKTTLKSSKREKRIVSIIYRTVSRFDFKKVDPEVNKYTAINSHHTLRKWGYTSSPSTSKKEWEQNSFQSLHKTEK